MPAHVNLSVCQSAKQEVTEGKASPVVVLDMGGQDRPLSQELADLCDYISPNESEAKRWFAQIDGGSVALNVGGAEKEGALSES